MSWLGLTPLLVASLLPLTAKTRRGVDSATDGRYGAGFWDVRIPTRLLAGVPCFTCQRKGEGADGKTHADAQARSRHASRPREGSGREGAGHSATQEGL